MSDFLGSLGFFRLSGQMRSTSVVPQGLGTSTYIKKSSKQSCETKHHRSLLGQSVAHFLYNVDDSRIHVYFIKKEVGHTEWATR